MNPSRAQEQKELPSKSLFPREHHNEKLAIKQDPTLQSLLTSLGPGSHNDSTGHQFLLAKRILHWFSLWRQRPVHWLFLAVEMVSDFTPQHTPVWPFPVLERVLDVHARLSRHELAIQGGGCEVGTMWQTGEA